MTEKTREQHAALIQFLHDDMVETDYFRTRVSLSVRAGIERALELGLKGCRSEGAFCQLAVRELMGLALGARMNNGTARTQAVVNFIEWAGMIAWCSQGRSYGTPEERKRLDYLFEVQANGKFFIPEPAPQWEEQQAQHTAPRTVLPEPDGVAEPEPETGFYVVVGEKRYVARLRGQASLAQIHVNEPVFPIGARVRFNTRLVYGCERAVRLKAIDEPKSNRMRGILIRSAGEVFVATQESNYQTWVAVAGGGSFPDTMGAVTYRLERTPDGCFFAVEIEASQ